PPPPPLLCELPLEREPPEYECPPPGRARATLAISKMSKAASAGQSHLWRLSQAITAPRRAARLRRRTSAAWLLPRWVPGFRARFRRRVALDASPPRTAPRTLP